MQGTSDIYKQILSNPYHTAEVCLDINSVTYYSDQIVSLSTSRSMFAEDRASVGGAVAAEINCTIYPTDGTAIPRMATMIPYVRITDGTNTSEWLQKGVFYIDTRSIDPETGLITIHGFDAMLKADQYYLTTSNQNTFPKAMSTVLTEICTRMSVTQDSRNSVTSYTMVKPDRDKTMRDVLGYIASANGGNWVMNDVGQLRLIKLGDIPAESYLLTDDYGNPISFGGVRIIVG